MAEMKRKMSAGFLPASSTSGDDGGIKFYGAGVGRQQRADSLLLLPKMPGATSVGVKVFEEGLVASVASPSRAPAAIVASPPPPCEACGDLKERVGRLMKGEANFRDVIRSLRERLAEREKEMRDEAEAVRFVKERTNKEEEEEEKKSAAVAAKKMGGLRAEAMEKQLKALESERDVAVRSKDDAERELLKMVKERKSGADDLRARIAELEAANAALEIEAEERRRVEASLRDAAELHRGQLGDERQAHGGTKARLNSIIAELRSELDGAGSKATQKNREITRLAEELGGAREREERAKQKERDVKAVTSNGTCMTPPRKKKKEEEEEKVEGAETERPMATSATQTAAPPGDGQRKSSGIDLGRMQRTLLKLETAVANETKAIQRHGHLLNLSNASTTRVSERKSERASAREHSVTGFNTNTEGGGDLWLAE